MWIFPKSSAYNVPLTKNQNVDAWTDFSHIWTQILINSNPDYTNASDNQVKPHPLQIYICHTNADDTTPVHSEHCCSVQYPLSFLNKSNFFLRSSPIPTSCFQLTKPELDMRHETWWWSLIIQIYYVHCSSLSLSLSSLSMPPERGYANHALVLRGECLHTSQSLSTCWRHASKRNTYSLLTIAWKVTWPIPTQSYNTEQAAHLAAGRSSASTF